MTSSAMMPNAVRVQWHDENDIFDSKVFTDLTRAGEFFKQLRSQGYRVSEVPLYNYQPDDECGIDSTGQPFEYDTEPLPLLNPEPRP